MSGSRTSACVPVRKMRPLSTIVLVVERIAEAAGLSLSPCWRRLRRLEADGVIRGYQALLDRKALGLGVTAFVRIDLERHSSTGTKRFEEAIQNIPEIVACHTISGEGTFMLIVVSQTLETYSKFALEVLINLPGVKDMHSSFSLKEVKSSSALPLDR
jgi:Lrp/AsnC family transcriptional regulator, leucine-responsive regulatory protein